MLEEIISHFGERILVLRHDVDNVYDIAGGRSPFAKKIANFILLASGRIGDLASLITPSRLDHLQMILDLEEAQGARATFFFRSVTAPTEKLASKLEGSGHRVGYHADDVCVKDFIGDLSFLERISNRKPRSFTGHGFAKIRGGGKYDEKLMIALGRIAGLDILAQGSGHPEWAVPRRIAGIWVFGHSRSLKKSVLEEIIEYATGPRIPLLLIHPEDLWKEEGNGWKWFEVLLSKFRCLPVEEVVDVLTKLLNEGT